MYRKMGDLMYEVKNLGETITYCKAYNAIIQDVPANDLVAQFFERIESKTGGFATVNLVEHAGIMDIVFNAFYVIDSFDPAHKILPMEPGATPGTHVVNFFVRPGRPPVTTPSE